MRAPPLLVLLAALLAGCAHSPRRLAACTSGGPAATEHRRPCCPPPRAARANLDCRCLRRARRASNKITLGMCGAVVLYGFAAFDYGSSSFRARDDGWFGRDTKEGGADKFGHMTSSALFTAALAANNRRMGIPRREAALRGAVGTWLFQAFVELGDGFSEEHGWTYGDMVANTAGAVFGYFQETSARFDRLLDLRWEYVPTHALFEEADDPLTDYDGSAYLFALNVGAVVHPRRRSWWDVVDVQAGYRTRNYVDMTGERERTPFVGVGLNVANLLRRLGVRGFVPALFEYYQLPFTSLRLHL